MSKHWIEPINKERSAQFNVSLDFKSSFVKREILFIFNIIDIFFKEPDYSFGRKKKFSDKAILKILIILKMFDKSYRKSEDFFRNNYEYLYLIVIDEIPSFQTISYRAITLER